LVPAGAGVPGRRWPRLQAEFSAFAPVRNGCAKLPGLTKRFFLLNHQRRWARRRPTRAALLGRRDGPEPNRRDGVVVTFIVLILFCKSSYRQKRGPGVAISPGCMGPGRPLFKSRSIPALLCDGAATSGETLIFQTALGGSSFWRRRLQLFMVRIRPIAWSTNCSNPDKRRRGLHRLTIGPTQDSRCETTDLGQRRTDFEAPSSTQSRAGYGRSNFSPAVASLMFANYHDHLGHRLTASISQSHIAARLRVPARPICP